TCLFGDQIEFNTHQRNSQQPIHVTEESWRRLVFHEESAHVIIVHGGNEGNQT
ncbi:MAG: hypothetical protein RL411_305, partial [Bacteroidota bacterium]